jgi:hypothetical protein
MEFVAENVGRAFAHISFGCQLQAQTDRGEDARKNLSLSKYVCVLHICGVVSCISSFRSELASFWVFQTYLQGIEKNKMFVSIFTNVTAAGSAPAALGQRANVHTAVWSN